ncbi:CBS domain-containing protein [bacterium CPR1]|nr:CBS domain-containing protein [bacterium CPR1]
MKVRDLMKSPVLSVGQETSLQELVELLDQKMITGVPVVDGDGKVIGVVSRSDVAVHWSRSEDGEDLRVQSVSEIMTPFAFQVRAEDEVVGLVDTMLAGGIHRVVVSDDEGRPVGIVTSMDIVRDYRRLLG